MEIVDAPVSGGVARAGQGDLLIMVGARRPRSAVAQPLLDVDGSQRPRRGSSRPGDGQKVKLVNQLLCGVHIAVAAEALAFAEALRPRRRPHVGSDCGTAPPHRSCSTTAVARMIDDPNNEVRSAIDIFVKDMGLVTAAARANGLPAPLACAAEQLYLAGRRAGLGRADDSSLIEILRGTAAKA